MKEAEAAAEWTVHF